MAPDQFQYNNTLLIYGGLISGEYNFVLTPLNLNVVSFPDTIYPCVFRFFDGDGVPLGTGIGEFVPEGFKGTNSIALSSDIFYILIIGPIEYYFTHITKTSATINWNNADFIDPLNLIINNTITITLPHHTSGSYSITGLNPDTTYDIAFRTQYGVSDSQEGLGTLTTLPDISFGITWFFSP
jgi:hypothetical protein